MSAPLGPRVATWSLGLWALRARGVCICMGPWARSARAARGLQAGVGSLVGGPLRRLHSRWGLCGRDRSRNSGPEPNESQDGKSTASCSMAISIQAWLPRERPGQRMDMELRRESRAVSGQGGSKRALPRATSVPTGWGQPLVVKSSYESGKDPRSLLGQLKRTVYLHSRRTVPTMYQRWLLRHLLDGNLRAPFYSKRPSHQHHHHPILQNALEDLPIMKLRLQEHKRYKR